MGSILILQINQAAKKSHFFLTSYAFEVTRFGLTEFTETKNETSKVTMLTSRKLIIIG